MKRIGDKRGQVWVETVIYTLIGLAIIGLVLAGALPKINAKKDEIMIDQSIEALGMIDDKIYEVQRAAGNRRVISLDVKSGAFVIDMEEDTLSWVLESSFPYSEVGISIPIGRMNVTTTGEDKPWTVTLTTKYNMNIKHNDQDAGKKQFDASPTPYNFAIENDGKEEGTIVINFNEN